MWQLQQKVVNIYPAQSTANKLEKLESAKAASSAFLNFSLFVLLVFAFALLLPYFPCWSLLGLTRSYWGSLLRSGSICYLKTVWCGREGARVVATDTSYISPRLADIDSDTDRYLDI